MTEPTGHPPIDAELEETVWQAVLEAGIGFDLTLEQIPALRETYLDTLPSPQVLERGGDVDVEERSIPGPQGAPELPAVILKPKGATGALPCIYYTANGGKIVQSPFVALTEIEADWVADLGVVFVSVSPRVGPENPHPAQAEDAYAGLVWTAEHADELGIDPNRILVMGKSGGGGSRLARR